MTIGNTVKFKRILNKKANEVWREGTIHHIRKLDGDTIITIHRKDDTYLKLIDDDRGGNWRKLGGVTAYEVEL